METDGEIMARFYNESGVKLSKNDKFLRSYILNEGWKDQNKMDDEQYAEADDFMKQEDDHEDEADAHEAAHNFRFEEPNAANITTHAR